MTALVGADRYAVCIFLDGSPHNVINTPIVTEVDDFHALGLDQPPHDVDCRVVAVEKRRSGYEPQGRRFTRGGNAGHVCSSDTHSLLLREITANSSVEFTETLYFSTSFSVEKILI
jgi:hypothetical protein